MFIVFLFVDQVVSIY